MSKIGTAFAAGSNDDMGQPVGSVEFIKEIKMINDMLEMSTFTELPIVPSVEGYSDECND